ncbi:ankyrin repeat protein [Hymenobacter sp. UYAg731]
MAHSGRPRKCDPKVDELRSNIRQGDYTKAKATLSEFGIDAADGDGRTALISAVIESKEGFIDWLLQNGANINHQDRIGYSALHFIAQNKQLEIAAKFLKSGANPNATDVHGNTPLWTAIFSSKDEKGVVKLLLEYGANPDIVNKHGKSPKEMFETFYKNDISEIV